jgi:8-oxo-dGTP pyrophosphatase MutT (NUDIX family)
LIREFSAGIVPFRKTPHGNEYLLLQSGLTMKELWEFPKGQIESGENSETTAKREFTEETGLPECDLVPGFKKVLKYFYRRRGELISKSVTYFLGEVTSGRVKLSHESVDYEWLTLEKALKKIKHKNIRELLLEVDNYLKQS